MYIIVQSFPEEKVLFASSSKTEAESFFNRQVQHGKGWFELKNDEEAAPLRSGGERFYAPYHPPQSGKDGASRSGRKDTAIVSGSHFPAAKWQPMIVTTFE